MNYHLFEHEDGDYYAAPDLESAIEAWVDATGEKGDPGEWEQIPDAELLIDGEDNTKTAAEHAREYLDNHGGPGYVGWFP